MARPKTANQPERGIITFYSVDKCGYYRRNEVHPEFGDLAVVTAGLLRWSARFSSLERTATYSRDPQGKFLESYCFDARKILANKSDLLITLWIRTEVTETTFTSVAGNSPPGSATVLANEVKPGYIPGVAAYFWVIPEKRAFATVRFGKQLSHQESFRRYMKGYLTNSSEFVQGRQSPDGTLLTILGYSAKSNSHLYTPKEIRPRFNVSRKKFPSDHSDILSRASKVIKIIQKNTLRWSDRADKTLLEKLINRLGTSTLEHAESGEVQIRTEISATPTREELRGIISNYDSDDSWEDIGFEFEGRGWHTEWLSHAYNRFEGEFATVRKSGIIDSAGLADALASQRNDLLEHLERSLA